MKNYYYLTLMFLLLTTTGWGQGFSRIYPPGNSYFQDVVTTLDGGYFMAGGTPSDSSLFMQRVGPTGNVLWEKHLHVNGAVGIAVCTSADNGFVVLAENYKTPQGLRNIIIKTNGNGDVLWQVQVDNNLLANGLRDIIRTSDGQLLAAGDTRDGQLRQNIWLVKISNDGAILWSNSLGDTQYNEQVNRVLELPNGHVVISGGGVHNADRDLFLAKTDADGNLLWEKWYTKPHVQNAHDLLLMSDGALAVLADTYGENPTKIALLRTDGDGVEDFFQQSSLGLTLDLNSPVNTVSSFATDANDNFYVLINTLSGVSGGFQKFDAFGDSLWTKPGGGNQIIRVSGGAYVVVGGSSQGAFLYKTDQEGEIYTNKLKGRIFHDQNGNCVEDAGELPLGEFIVRVKDEFGYFLYQNAAADGTYSIPVAEGNYTVSVTPRYGTENFWMPCDSQLVSVIGDHQTIIIPPLGLRALAECPVLDVEVGNSLFRRCTSNTLNVNYCNNGNLTATNVILEITPDPKMTYEGSTATLVSQTNGVLTFSVPDLLPGNCGSFDIYVAISCAAELGEVLCTEAHIYPDSICLPANANWDGSNLVVNGSCNGDIQFTIRNTGPGNMLQQVDYVIIEDQIMYMQGKVQLDAQEDTVITVPNPTGTAYYLHTDQSTGHPGYSHPSTFIQQCNTNANSNLALQLPQDDADLFTAIHCDEVIGSYDPNDKRGFPLGWQAAHFITPDQELEYMIRFQNTGTDTAFQVIIRDTITPLLDVTTLRAGASSHPYTYTVSGQGVITFTFDNILLPDSNVNEAASHGYVMFRLRQRSGLGQGDLIQNHAAIYFDSNAPVITNTTFHTVGYPLLSVTTDRPAANDLVLQVYPNPSADQVNFQIAGMPVDSHFQLSLFSVQGALIRQEQFVGSVFQFQRAGLLPGVYFFQLMEQNGRVARGKIIVR